MKFHAMKEVFFSIDSIEYKQKWRNSPAPYYLKASYVDEEGEITSIVTGVLLSTQHVEDLKAFFAVSTLKALRGHLVTMLVRKDLPAACDQRVQYVGISSKYGANYLHVIAHCGAFLKEFNERTGSKITALELAHWYCDIRRRPKGTANQQRLDERFRNFLGPKVWAYEDTAAGRLTLLLMALRLASPLQQHPLADRAIVTGTYHALNYIRPDWFRTRVQQKKD